MEIPDLVVPEVANDSSDSPVGDGDGAGLYTSLEIISRFESTGREEENSRNKVEDERQRGRKIRQLFFALQCHGFYCTHSMSAPFLSF